MRLDKLIEQELKTTRKQMKRLFLRGKVLLDGQPIYQESRNVDSALFQIEVDGQKLVTQESYFLLNKPQGYVTANQDVLPTVFELLHEADRAKPLYAVGRLDRDTEGLLLLTSNGQLGYDLLQPNKKVDKCYEVLVNDRVTQQDIETFATGVVFADGTICQPAQLAILSASATVSRVELTLCEGKFHQVKKMFLATGKKVIFLKRISMGPLHLDGLQTGNYRQLTQEELLKLKPYFR